MRNALLTRGQHSASGHLPRRTIPVNPIRIFDPAINAMSDFSRQYPVTVSEDRQIGAALTDMARLGVRPFLHPDHQGPIIVNFHAPDHPAWDLQHFVDALKKRGVVISNFYNTPTPGFRVGCIGAITPSDMAGAVEAMSQALRDIGVTIKTGANHESGS